MGWVPTGRVSGMVWPGVTGVAGAPSTLQVKSLPPTRSGKQLSSTVGAVRVMVAVHSSGSVITVRSLPQFASATPAVSRCSKRRGALTALPQGSATVRIRSNCRSSASPQVGAGRVGAAPEPATTSITVRSSRAVHSSVKPASPKVVTHSVKRSSTGRGSKSPQLTIRLVGSCRKTGAVVSITVKTCVKVVALSQSSLTVHVRSSW